MRTLFALLLTTVVTLVVHAQQSTITITLVRWPFT
jgi:hypothetical protein